MKNEELIKEFVNGSRVGQNAKGTLTIKQFRDKDRDSIITILYSYDSPIVIKEYDIAYVDSYMVSYVNFYMVDRRYSTTTSRQANMAMRIINDNYGTKPIMVDVDNFHKYLIGNNQPVGYLDSI